MAVLFTATKDATHALGEAFPIVGGIWVITAVSCFFLYLFIHIRKKNIIFVATFYVRSANLLAKSVSYNGFRIVHAELGGSSF